MEQNKRLVHQSKMLGVPLDGPVFQTMTLYVSKQNGDECGSQVEQDMIYWQLIQKIESICGGDREFFCELAPEEYFILINADSPDKAEQRTSDMAERLVVEIGHNDGSAFFFKTYITESIVRGPVLSSRGLEDNRKDWIPRNKVS